LRWRSTRARGIPFAALGTHYTDDVLDKLRLAE
jgi:hypothetical protein